MIVAKFGGTVLNGAEGVRRLRDEIRRLPGPLLVVLSAFADITNRLERLAETATRDAAEAASQRESIIEYHRAIAREVLSDAAYMAWDQQVEPYCRRLEEVVRGLAIVRELSPRTLDLVVHFGERFSSSIMLEALGDGMQRGAVGIPALDLIITDTTHRYARPDMELTRERVESKLRPLLTGDAVVLTEGYIARSTAGEATTMGRESSDFSATLLGEMLHADEVRIYTNVPGILTADPTRIPSATVLPRLSYVMAHTLAELGAKILHARTVTPVERGAIPLVIRSIDTEGTTISDRGEREAYSIVLLPGVTVITLTTSTASSGIDPFLRAVGAVAPIIWHHRFRRLVQLVTVRPVAQADLPLHLINEEVEGATADMSLVSLVSERELTGDDLRRFFGCVGERVGVAIQGDINNRAISIALPEGDAAEVTALLHRHFVEEGGGPVSTTSGTASPASQAPEPLLHE
jgi:aspartate kinase